MLLLTFLTTLFVSYALVQGCTDAAACNYDETAEQDNGTCEYAAEGFDCDGHCLEGTSSTINVEELYLLELILTLLSWWFLVFNRLFTGL